MVFIGPVSSYIHMYTYIYMLCIYINVYILHIFYKPTIYLRYISSIASGVCSQGPRRVHHLSHERFSDVACGGRTSAAVSTSGRLYLWGSGFLGHGGLRTAWMPTQLRLGRRIKQVACGHFHAAAVARTGELFTWGEGFGGKLGHGDSEDQLVARQVPMRGGYYASYAYCLGWG